MTHPDTTTPPPAQPEHIVNLDFGHDDCWCHDIREQERRRRRLTAEQADRLAQERPPYPPLSERPDEQCSGSTGWHRPQADDWNRGNRESTCTWCGVSVERKFADPVWREVSGG